MQSGSPFCGDCAARDEIAAGVGDMGAFSNNVECFLCGPCYKQHLQENGEDYDTGFKDGQIDICENYVLLSYAVDELRAIGREDAIDALREIYFEDALTDYPDIDW